MRIKVISYLSKFFLGCKLPNEWLGKQRCVHGRKLSFLPASVLFSFHPIPSYPEASEYLHLFFSRYFFLLTFSLFFLSHSLCLHLLGGSQWHLECMWWQTQYWGTKNRLVLSFTKICTLEQKAGFAWLLQVQRKKEPTTGLIFTNINQERCFKIFKKYFTFAVMDEMFTTPGASIRPQREKNPICDSWILGRKIMSLA